MWNSILDGLSGAGGKVSSTLTDAWSSLTEEEQKELFGQIEEFNQQPTEAFADFGSAPTEDYSFSLKEPVNQPNPQPRQGYNFSTEGLGADQLAKDVGWNSEKATSGMKFIPETYEEWKKSEEDSWMGKVGKGLQSLGQLSPRTGQQQMGGGGVRTGGGTNIQTRDEYAEAMKALVEKYGHFMFNKDF